MRHNDLKLNYFMFQTDLIVIAREVVVMKSVLGNISLAVEVDLDIVTKRRKRSLRRTRKKITVNNVYCCVKCKFKQSFFVAIYTQELQFVYDKCSKVLQLFL